MLDTTINDYLTKTIEAIESTDSLPSRCYTNTDDLNQDQLAVPSHSPSPLADVSVEPADVDVDVAVVVCADWRLEEYQFKLVTSKHLIYRGPQNNRS